MKYTQLALILACSISKRQFIPVYYIMQAYTHSTHISFLGGWLRVVCQQPCPKRLLLSVVKI